MSKLRTNEIEPVSGTQISIGASPTNDPSNILNVQSTTQGVSLPRMTTAQRNAIPSPSEGLLIYNLDDGRLEQYSSGQWTVAGNGQTPIQNVLRVVKNPVLNAGDFSSINAALASITTNSPTNTFSIEVGPGIFIENPIHMKPYVFIKGQDFDSTIIQANDPTEHLIFGCEFSSISSCLLTGVTLAGKALLYYASATGTQQTTFWADNVRFGQSDTLAISDGTLAHSNLFIVNCRFGGVYQFNTGFVARSPGPTLGRIIMFNSTSSKMTSPYPADMFLGDGAGSELYLKSVAARTGVVSGGGNGIRMRNGAQGRISSIDITGWSKGLWVENVGADAPFLVMSGVFTDNTIDVKNDNSNLFGGMDINAEEDSKIILVTAPNFGYTIVSEQTGSVLLSGNLEQTQPDGTFTDITTLTANTSSLGILVSGDINPPVSPTSFTVNVEAGLGYLQKSDGSLRKISWPDTLITLPASSISYLYFDQTATLLSSGIKPDSTQNIILGKVVTHATGIELVEESGFQSTHMANRLSNAMRDGLGAIYNAGSIATEVGTRNLMVTAGDYFFGELQFKANGGNPITWVSFYQNGLGGFTRVPGQTVADNAFYDNGTGTLAAIGAGNYAKHSLYALGDSTNDFDSEAYFVVYSQAQYTALTLAEQGSLPSPPNFLSEGVTIIASIIVQQGTANIIEILDERNIVGSGKIATVTANTFHHNLQGLNDFDDHLRYLPVNGTRAMAANLPMGGFDITNVNTINFPSLTASLPLQLNASKNVIASAIDLSSLQVANTLPINHGGTNSNTALNNNRVMISVLGAIVEAAAITANRALASNSSGIPVASATTDTELGFVSGVTSSIQTQLNGKQPTGNYITALTGDVTATGPGSVAATIANSAVTNAKMANMANNTVKANKSGGSAAPSDLVLSDVTETTSSILTISNGSKSVVSASNLTIQVTKSDTTHDGYLSSTDWNTFNNKQPAGSYITALTGEVSASGPGSASATLSNAAVIAKVLTGFVSGPNSTILASDSILSAFQKTQSQIDNSVRSIKANAGTAEVGAITLLNGNGTTVTDSPAGSFTIDTKFGANEFVITSTSGLTINYTGGRFVNGSNGTINNIASGSIVVSANVTLGYLYVAINNLTSTGTVTASTTPPSLDSIPFAQFVSGPSTITSTTDIRAFVNVVPLANALRVTYSGSGLSVSYNATGVRINGTLTTIAAGSIALTDNTASGAIYVDPTTMVVTANTTGLFPANCTPMATYTTASGAVTVLTGARSFINNNVVFGASGDIVTIVPNAAAAAGATNKYADAGHTHAIATTTASTISTNANAEGAGNNFARATHTHQLTAAAASNDHVPQYDGTNWQAVYPESYSGARAYRIFEDWISNTSAGQLGWTAVLTGGGSTANTGSTGVDSNHPGVLSLTAGNAAARFADVHLGPTSLILGGGTLVLECLFNLQTLTNVAYRFGLGDTNAADQVNGVYLEYNSGVSANWLIKTASASTRTSTTTTVAATASAWHKLVITVNAAASSVSYTLDGVSLGSISTNIPTAAIAPHLQSDSLAGTSSTAWVDYFNMYQRFTTSR